MSGLITYGGRVGIEAIAAWCDENALALDSVRRLFALTTQSPEDAVRTSFADVLGAFKSRLETPGLLEGLDPEASWRDAKTYMAHLVCYVWNNSETHNSNGKAVDYVFRVAREGSRLYADCRYARTLLEKYGKQTSTIRKEAKLLHAGETHFKKRKWRGVERPPTLAQLARKSKAAEDRQKKKAGR